MPIIYKPRTRYNATNGIQSTITVADPPSGYGGQPHTIAFQHYQSHTCVPVVCTGFTQGSKKSKQQSRSMMFRVIPCVQFYRLTQLLLSTLLKVIIRKECQSFTNHGHAKTPPTVFNPLSLWLTLPRDMGVSHTLWPYSITRAILACLWFAQGSKKSKQQSRSMMFRVVLCIQFID